MMRRHALFCGLLLLATLPASVLFFVLDRAVEPTAPSEIPYADLLLPVGGALALWVAHVVATTVLVAFARPANPWPVHRAVLGALSLLAAGTFVVAKTERFLERRRGEAMVAECDSFDTLAIVRWRTEGPAPTRAHFELATHAFGGTLRGSVLAARDEGEAFSGEGDTVTVRPGEARAYDIGLTVRRPGPPARIIVTFRLSGPLGCSRDVVFAKPLDPSAGWYRPKPLPPPSE